MLCYSEVKLPDEIYHPVVLYFLDFRDYEIEPALKQSYC